MHSARQRSDRIQPRPAAAASALALLALVMAPAAGPATAQSQIPSVPGITLRGAVEEPAPAAAPPPKAPAATEAPAAAAPADPPAATGEKKKAATAKSTPEKAPSEKKPAAKPKDAAAAPADASPPKSEKTAAIKTDGKQPKGSRSIAVLVNDDPITAYEIEQRATFIAVSSGGAGGGDMKAKAEARWKSIMKDPKTNERFQKLLREKAVRTQEEARSLQTEFVKDLQRNMLEGLKREARSSALTGSKTKAQDELIDEKLKLQEAKKLSVVASDEDVDRIIGNIAERNKMTLAQFGQHMKGMGVDISTMRARFLAELSWREVVRRKFGRQIEVDDRDVDRVVAANPSGEDDVELQLQRIAIFTPAKIDQKILAQKLAEAQALAAKFTGCTSTKALAAQIQGARFEDLGSRSPSAIPEPTRSMLLNARDGDMLPPVVGDGSVELWAVCGRKTVTANEQKREEATAELRSKEFEIFARKHLKDLRQDAAIEYR